jgi:hypothetical protein
MTGVLLVGMSAMVMMSASAQVVAPTFAVAARGLEVSDDAAGDARS